MVERSRQDAYFQWLSSQVSPTLLPHLRSIYMEIEKNFLGRKVLHQPLFETTDLKTLAAIRDTMEKNHFFRLMHRRDLPRMSSAIRFYIQYCKTNIEKPNADIDYSSTNGQDAYRQAEIQGTPTLGTDAETPNQQTLLGGEILETIQAHYGYGFNISSPIEIIRFQSFYAADHGRECVLSAERLQQEIQQCGYLLDGKVYAVAEDARERIMGIINDAVADGYVIFYLAELFAAHEDWLYGVRVHSPELLGVMLAELFPSYRHKGHYFLACADRISEFDALVVEIRRIWGAPRLRTFSELKQALPYIPLEKIKQVLSRCDLFVWDSTETYAYRERFQITDEQVQTIIEYASTMCDENGSVSFEELPLEEVAAENYDLSTPALYDMIFGYLSDTFARNHQAITRKEDQVGTEEAIKSYCMKRDICTFAELEQVMQGIAGSVRLPVLIEAACSVMVRTDVDMFVADSKVHFDTAAIDAVLDSIVTGDSVGMREITTFGAFPDCGQPWGLFILESYCRRFSRKYKYLCASTNSQNAGAVVKVLCQKDYHSIMAQAVANSSVPLTETDVFDYLLTTGYIARRRYSSMADLIGTAGKLREGRN